VQAALAGLRLGAAGRRFQAVSVAKALMRKGVRNDGARGLAQATRRAALIRLCQHAEIQYYPEALTSSSLMLGDRI